MNKKLKNTAKFTIFLALGLFLVWLITHNLTEEQWERVRSAFREANYWLLIPVFIVGALSHFVRALRWRLLIFPLGYVPGIISTYAAVMIGYLANLALPRLGEITRCGVLSRHERIPVERVIGTMIAERVIDIICLAFVIALTVLIQIDLVGHFFYQIIGSKVSSFFQENNLIHTIIILVIVIAGLTGIWYFLKLFRNTHWYLKFRSLVAGVKEGILTTLKLENKFLFLVYTFLIWVCYFLMVYIGFRCFESTASLGIKAGLSVLSFGSIGMIVTQGGIGAYQLIVEKTIELYGVLEAYGFAFAWLSWMAQTGLIMLLGFTGMLVMPFLKRRKLIADTGKLQHQ